MEADKMLCLDLGQGSPRPAGQLQGWGGRDRPPTGWGRAAWPEPAGTGAGSTQGRHSCSKTSRPSCPHCPSLALTGLWLDPSHPLGLTLSPLISPGAIQPLADPRTPDGGTKDASWAPGMEKPVALPPRTHQPATQSGPQGPTGPALNGRPRQGPEWLRDPKTPAPCGSLPPQSDLRPSPGLSRPAQGPARP